MHDGQLHTSNCGDLALITCLQNGTTRSNVAQIHMLDVHASSLHTSQSSYTAFDAP
jgi:hypothetical protein